MTRKGYALPSALILVSLLLLMSLVLVDESAANLSMARQETTRARALATSEAGLSWAVEQLRDDNEAELPAEYRDLEENRAEFMVQVFRSGSDERAVSPGFILVESTGRVKGSKQTQLSSALIKIGKPPPPLIRAGLVGNTVDLVGSVVEVFNSAGGLWSRVAYSSDTPLLATNSATKGSIRLDRGSQVNGNVLVGVGGKVGPPGWSKPTYHSTATVWKRYSYLQGGEVLAKPMNLPDVARDDTGSEDVVLKEERRELAPGSYRKIVLQGGGKVYLGPGNYTVDRLAIKTGGALIVRGGTARVKIQSELVVEKGGRLNSRGKPRRLLTQFPAGAKIRILPGARAAAVVYAPKVPFSLTEGASLRGAVVAKTILLKQSAFSFDEDVVLRPPDLGLPGMEPAQVKKAGFEVTSWEIH